jgi:carbamoyl-phosphate synthase small subunit
LEAILALEDGSVFRGRHFGAAGERWGEVVFNTGMTGYQEILTDPSYCGQIVVMTCPQIGNTGVNPVDRESGVPQVDGFVVREFSPSPSSWRANQALHHYLKEHGIVGLSEVDTRALTRRIRIHGALRGVLSTVERNTSELVRKARIAPRLESQDLVSRVTCAEPYEWHGSRPERWASGLPASVPRRRWRCVAYDFGAKRNIFRMLEESGFDITVVPARHPAAETLSLRPDLVFLSNGPGDPATATYAIEAVRGLIGRAPLFGICLGHQITALALGGKTYKLKFGHRGINHPVKDVHGGSVLITSQTHGIAGGPESLPKSVSITHVNLNDGTCEGFADRDARLLAVQFHPEASPGPHDALHLFRTFRDTIVCSSDCASSAPEGQRP